MSNQSRKGQVRACGHVWYPEGDGVATTIGDKFEVTTWRFGDIHQCKVFVHYPNPRDPRGRESVGICLPPSPTRVEAMRRGLDWVASYKAPDSPDELFAKQYRRWRSLYRTRADLLDQLFFTIGNGYAWVGGAIVPTYYDDGARERAPVVAPEGSPKYLSGEYFKLPVEQQQVISAAHYDAEEAALPVGPLPDDGGPRNFYPVCGYSLVACVPDDVRADWLAVAYEAALMLRDRQTPRAPEKARYAVRGGKLREVGSSVDPDEQARCDSNIAHGRRIVAELEARFPHLVAATNSLDPAPAP